MDKRKGEEFLEYRGSEHEYIPGEWRIAYNLWVSASRECPHTLISKTGGVLDIPRALQVRSDEDPYEVGELCLDCLIDAMRELGILTEKDLN